LTCSTVDLDQCVYRQPVQVSSLPMVRSAALQGPSSLCCLPSGDVIAPRDSKDLRAFVVPVARCAVYRVLGRHEVAQEPSGSGEYTGPTTFLRTSKPPKEGDGAKGVRSGVSAGRLAGGAPVGLGQVRRAKARKASQQRKPSARCCPRRLDGRLRGNRPSFDSSELGSSLPRKPSSLTKGMLRPAPRCLRGRGVRV
jgi:hypothetical protein